MGRRIKKKKLEIGMSKGFTLIEVLIALMIIAIALVASARATYSSIYTTQHVREEVAAHWVAMNVISEIQVGLLNQSAFNHTLYGKTKMLHQTWNWTATMTENSLQLEKIVVNVQLQHRFIASVIGYYAA